MDLGARAALAFRWAASASFLSQLITWSMTVLVIRILTPDDYGLMAMAMLFVSFLALTNELGMGAVLVQRRELDEDVKAKVFALTLLVNGSFYFAIFSAAPWLATFFEEDRLSLVLRVLSIQFLISAFEIVPLAQLEREMDFKRKSLVYLAANATGGIVTLGCALAGFGVWALVCGSLWISVGRTVGTNLVSPFLRLPKFQFAGMRDLFTFGGLVMTERVLWFLYTQADIFIVGKLLGKTLLGYYSVAMNLASLIMHKTGGVLYEVAFPTFSRAQSESDVANAFFLKGVRVMSFLSFPVFFGIASVAPEIVTVLLGDRWEPAAPILTVLSLVMPLRMISNLLPPVLQGLGRPEISVTNLGIALLLMPAAFALGTLWGLIGVALAWLICFPVVFLVMLHRTGKVLGIRLSAFLTAMWGPCLASALMYLAVVAGREWLGEAMHPVLRFGSLIILGAATYGAVVAFRYRELCLEVVRLARR